MKRMLIAAGLALAAGGVGGQAFAADLPPPQAPPPRAPATYVPMAAPVFSWTGIYIGLNGGYAFGDSNWSAPGFPSTGSFSTDGFLIGGTLGANYQFGSFVVGIEGDGDWTNLDGTTLSNCAPVTCETKSDWLATVRGRAGWAWDRILFYGTGGAAFGAIQTGFSGGTFDSSTEVGWTAGAGIEAAFAPNWTARIEYLYVDFGNATCSVATCGGGPLKITVPTTVSLTENLVRAGIDYKFGW